MLGFPQNTTGLCDICFYLLGNKEVDHSEKVMELLRNFDSFVVPLNRSLLEKIPLGGREDFDFVMKEDFEYGIKIPEGTKVRQFKQRKEYYEVNIRYDVWAVLMDMWLGLLEYAKDRTNSEARLKQSRRDLESVCGFVSKLLTINPTKIEDINIGRTEASTLEKNLEEFISFLLQSLEQLKIILISLREESDIAIKKTLDTMGMILSAIGGLYSQPSYRKVVTERIGQFEKNINDFERPYSSIYSTYGTSGHNKLNHMLKELNNVEYSVGEYPITKAVSKLGSIIMADPYPSQSLMSILDCVKDLKYKSSKENLEIQKNLLETYKHALLKFLTSPNKTNYQLRSLQNDSFLATLKEFLNDADIQKILEETLELERNDLMSLDNLMLHDVTQSLPFINKIFKRYKEDLGSEDLEMIRTVVLISLECLHIILDLIYIQLIVEKDKEAKENLGYLHQLHLTHLGIVQYIKEALLNNASFVTDLDDNKLLLTIASYIHFENRYGCQVNKREPSLDGVRSSVVSYESCSNVSTVALKCMNQIVRIWELYPVSKRPSLASYLTYESNSFTYAHVIMANALSHPEEAYTLLEFLICCINTQLGFINTLFKDEKFFKSINDVFCKHFERVANEAQTDRQKRKVIGMLIILISHLLQNTKIKSNKAAKEMIKEFLAGYLINSKDTIYTLFIQREEYSPELFDMSIKSYDFRRYRDRTSYLERDALLEQRVRDVCFYNHVVGSYLLIICNLLTSLDKDNLSKKQALQCLAHIHRGQIQEILKLCTTKRLTNTGEVMTEFTEYLARLGDQSNLALEDSSDDLRRTPFPVSDMEDLLIPLEQLQYYSCVEKPVDKTQSWKYSGQSAFRKNLYGYGRSFVIDRNELFYMLKTCYYDSRFIDDFVNILGKYNLEMSLLDSERLLLSNVHDMFAFISSLGHDGFLGSSHDKIPSSIKKSSNEVNYGFSFFTIVGGIAPNIKKDEFMN